MSSTRRRIELTDDCGTYQPNKGLTFQQMKDMYAREGIGAIMGASEKSYAAMGSSEHIKELKHEYRQLEGLKSLQRDIFETADKSGWHERKRELPEILALVHSEVSEALEAYRDGMAVTETKYRYLTTDINRDLDFEDPKYTYLDYPETEDVEGNSILGKPEGVASELADVIIRILDASEELEIETARVLIHKMRYNKTRAYRHGGKVI